MQIMKQTVQDLMNAFPILVDQDTPIIEVFRIFRRKKVSHLLIVSGLRLVGVISKEDLLNKMVDLSEISTGHKYNEIILKSTLVKEIMSRDLVVAHPNDQLLEAVSKMLKANVHCLPVLNDADEPIGILNPIDLLNAMQAREQEAF